MEPRFRFRLYLLTALVLLGTVSLLHRLHHFQIKQQHYYIQKKPGFSVVSIRQPGVRGEISDRNGVPLAENYQVYELAVNLEEVRKEWASQWENETMDAGGKKGPTIDQIVEKILLPRLKEIGVEPRFNRTAIKTHHLSHGGLEPYIFPGELDFEQFSRLAENNLGLRGVYVNSRPRRRYPQGSLAGHVLGYVQQWKKGTYTEAERKEFGPHYFGDSKGVSGVEKTYNEILTGLYGKRSLFKDEKNKIIGRTMDSRAPSKGADLTLTLDAGIQCLTENVLRKAGRAAAVVMDVNTGEVLAMASVPNYDPGDFVPSLSQTNADFYYKNSGRPLNNRAVSRYQSASTTKIPVALTAAMNGQIGFTDNCRGYVSFGSTKVRCHRTSGHGTLAIESALQRSCNPYFMDLANRMGRKNVVEGFSILNLGRRTGVGLPDENPGILPGSELWLQQQEPGTIVTNSQVALMSIGQWQMECTPLQVCAVTACVANGGKYYKPRLLKKAELLGEVIVPDRPQVQVDLVKDKGVSPAAIQRIAKGMWMAANAPGGTALRVSGPGFESAAKTGTVQVRKAAPKINNAWVTAFAPYDNPRYAVTVFVEGGASGGKVGGPLAHMILRGIAASEKGLRLPVKRMGKFAGHFDRIEEIELPENSLLTIVSEEEGETGDEVSGAVDENQPVKVTPRIIPLPGSGGGDSSGGDSN